MKYLKILSIIAIVISISAMAAKFYSFSKTASFNFPTYDENAAKADSVVAITNYDMNQMKEIVLDSASNIDYTHKARLKSKMAAGAIP